MGDRITENKRQKKITSKIIEKRVKRYFLLKRLIELEGPITSSKNLNIRLLPTVFNVWGLFRIRFLFDSYKINMEEWILFNCAQSDLVIDFMLVDEEKENLLVKQFAAITIDATRNSLSLHGGNVVSMI